MRRRREDRTPSNQAHGKFQTSDNPHLSMTHLVACNIYLFMTCLVKPHLMYISCNIHLSITWSVQWQLRRVQTFLLATLRTARCFVEW
jgi:hypothetical protein